MSRSNCITCAIRLYLRMRKRWVEQGRQAGKEPYILVRPSRLAVGIPHLLVGKWSGKRFVVVSFKPSDSSPLPWWRWWQAVKFDGKLVRGD